MRIILPILITPRYLDIVLFCIGLFAFSIILYFFYRFILKPSLKILADTNSPPPQQGEKRELTFKDTRQIRYRIGLFDSDWKLRMKGIVEDHLIINFKKDRALEEYEIDLIPGGVVFYRAPHEQQLIRIKNKERIESRELIGHPAILRLVAALQGERQVHYVELELSTRYYIDNAGDERMKFIIELQRVWPGVAMNSRNKRGVYNFGREAGATEDS